MSPIVQVFGHRDDEADRALTHLDIGSSDREHETVSLRSMDGKIASVVPAADVPARIRGATRR
jgi:hypothetical protein